MIQRTLLQSTPSIYVAMIIFVLIIIGYLFGHRLRRHGIKKNPNESGIELGAINGTLLGLLGLLLAFTFSMASSRFDARRQTIIAEANNIGTAVLRTDIYPDSIRQLLRTNLKEYVETRIDYYLAGRDMKKIQTEIDKTNAISHTVWLIAANYAKVDPTTTRTSQLIPALNEMIDITTTRLAASEANIPDSIMYFLLILCLCSAFLLGYDNKNKIDWVVVMGLAIMLSATVFTIIDLDRPRSGLITLDGPNQKIVQLRSMFE